ncbi:peptide chain release factor 1 [archaeon]|nr:peptide chain release factor 1 [archaeon]
MIDKKTVQKLKRFITELKGIRGRHTELVTVYVPEGYDLNKIIQQLAQEQGTASNIKDKTTQKHVIDSLERMIRHLRLYKKTPERGLAVFAGNTDSHSGKLNLKVWSIEPPQPIKTKLYRCDQTFVLDPLMSQLDIKETYGLIVVDKREANVGLLKGTSIKELKGFTSNVPGKVRAGGQSQQRFARLREGAAKDFYKRVAAVVNQEFLKLGKDLKGVLVGGPGHTKQEFTDGGYLNTEIKDKIITMQDLSYTGAFGLNELVDKSDDVLAQERIMTEKKLLQEFFEKLAKEPDVVTYGLQHVKEALQLGAVKIILVSDTVDESLIEELESLAAKTGAIVEEVSDETNEGQQLKEIGEIGAILRFAV